MQLAPELIARATGCTCTARLHGIIDNKTRKGKDAMLRDAVPGIRATMGKTQGKRCSNEGKEGCHLLIGRLSRQRSVASTF